MVYIGNKDSGSGANDAAAIEYDYDDCDICACGECAAGGSARTSDLDLYSSQACPDNESVPSHYRLWLKDIYLPTGYHDAVSYSSSSTALASQSYVYFSWYNFLVNHLAQGLDGLPILLTKVPSSSVWWADFYVGDFFVAGDTQRTWDVSGVNDIGPSDIEAEHIAFRIELSQIGASASSANPPSVPSGTTLNSYHELTIKLMSNSVLVLPGGTGTSEIEVFRSAFTTTCSQTFPAPNELIGPLDNEYSGERVETWDSGHFGRDMPVPSNGIAYLMACEGEQHIQDYKFDHFGNLHNPVSGYDSFAEGTLQLDRNSCYKLDDSGGITYRKEESDSYAFDVNAGDSNSPVLYNVGEKGPLGDLILPGDVVIDPTLDSTDYWRYYYGVGALCGAITPSTQGDLSSRDIQFYSFGALYEGQISLSDDYDFDFDVKGSSSYYVAGMLFREFYDKYAASFTGGVSDA